MRYNLYRNTISPMTRWNVYDTEFGARYWAYEMKCRMGGNWIVLDTATGEIWDF